MSLFPDLGSLPRSKVLEYTSTWIEQLFVLCLMGITVAIVQWSERSLWIAVLALVVAYAALLLFAILLAVKFLQQESDGRENRNASELAER